MELSASQDNQTPFSVIAAAVVFSFLSVVIGIAIFVSILLTFNIISPPISYL